MNEPHTRHRYLRWAWLFCLTLTVLGLVYALLLVVIERGVSEQRLVAYLLVHAPQPPLLAPLCVFAVLCLMLLQWRLAVANTAVFVAAAMVLMPPAVPHLAPKHEPGQRLRVVTWNVHGEVWNLRQIQDTLARLQPDIVCLQEAEPEGFAQALPGAQTAHTHEGRILTRGRIVSKRTFPLAAPGTSRWGLSTDIILPQGRLSVLNVHYVVGIRRHIAEARRGRPDPIESARATANERVLAWLRSTRGPRMVCGDFNTPPGARLYRALRAEAQDAFAQAGLGWGFTYSRRRPIIRIDYVWCTGGVIPVRSRVQNGQASDHRLVVTDLVLPR
jgi:endonuclease/exonuclease/phosphatase (EEP) superfamily protein YafD